MVGSNGTISCKKTRVVSPLAQLSLGLSKTNEVKHKYAPIFPQSEEMGTNNRIITGTGDNAPKTGTVPVKRANIPIGHLLSSDHAVTCASLGRLGSVSPDLQTSFLTKQVFVHLLRRNLRFSEVNFVVR